MTSNANTVKFENWQKKQTREKNWCKQRHIYVNDSILTFSREREDVWREYYKSIRQSGASYNFGIKYFNSLKQKNMLGENEKFDCSWDYENPVIGETPVITNRLAEIMREIARVE
jgi:hypothetical protein